VPKTIGIVGSRRRNSEEDYRAVEAAFAKIWKPGDNIVSGGCKKGADSFIHKLAEVGCGYVEHLPDESKLDPELLEVNPRAAYAEINYARNTLIANDADFLIACVAADRQGGTEDTIKKFLKKTFSLSSKGRTPYKVLETAAVNTGRLILV